MSFLHCESISTALQEAANPRDVAEEDKYIYCLQALAEHHLFAPSIYLQASQTMSWVDSNPSVL